MQSTLPFSQVETPAKALGSDVQLRTERAPLVRVLIRGTLLAGATLVGLRFLSDPDLWGHLRFGLDVLSTLGIHEGDPYSFTSDRVWINHEWLFEVLIALFYTIGGTKGLAVLVAATGLAALGLARFTIRRAGVHGWRLDVMSIAVFVIGIAPLARTARPQSLSLVMFVALLLLIREFDRGRHRAVFALPLLFLLWANSHGGWIVGGAVLAIWTFARMAAHREARVWSMLLGIGIVSAAATLVNPYGVGLWHFLLETVRFERSDIEEWQRVTTLTDHFAAWLGMTVVAFLCAARARRQEYAYIALCAFLGISAFFVLRLVPFFSLATLILLAPLLAARPETVRERIDARSLAAALFVWMFCVSLSAAGPSKVGCIQPVPRLQLDPRAVSFLQENGAKGKLLVWFDWGEYALWHFSPGLRVSMDGRRETAYSQETIASHLEFYRNGPGARRYLERLAPDYVWLPPSLPVSASLAGWGWQPIFQSEMSTIWARGPVPSSWRPPQPLTTSCFPAA